MIRRSICIALFAVVALSPLLATGQELDPARLGKALDAVRKWTHGQKADELKYVADVVVRAGNTPSMRAPVEGQLIAALRAEAAC